MVYRLRIADSTLHLLMDEASKSGNSIESVAEDLISSSLSRNKLSPKHSLLQHAAWKLAKSRRNVFAAASPAL